MRSVLRRTRFGRAARCALIAGGLAVGLAVPTAEAVDGVLEINQACATETGCFSGDSAGYPVTIDGSAGRSYRLTGDLVVPDATTNGIVIGTPSVSIDLNGFEIARSGCVGATASCRPSTGTGTGILSDSSANRGISVRNGSVTGMGNHGVFLGVQAEVSGLRVRWNRANGIQVSSGSRVDGSLVYENGSMGIVTSTSANVSTSDSHRNGATGISTGSGSMVTHCTSVQNEGTGIAASAASTVSDSSSYDNTGNGIFVTSGSTVSGNSTFGNSTTGITASGGSVVSGNSVYGNGTDGISAGNGAMVRGNSVYNNDRYGLSLSSVAAYRENVIGANSTAAVTGGIDLGGNSCDGTATCP